jgi:hypothetical protein
MTRKAEPCWQWVIRVTLTPTRRIVPVWPQDGNKRRATPPGRIPQEPYVAHYTLEHVAPMRCQTGSARAHTTTQPTSPRALAACVGVPRRRADARPLPGLPDPGGRFDSSPLASSISHVPVGVNDGWLPQKKRPLPGDERPQRTRHHTATASICAPASGLAGEGADWLTPRHTPHQCSTIANPHLAWLSGLWDVRSFRNVCGHGGSARSRNNPRDRMSGTRGGSPTGRRSSGNPHSLGCCPGRRRS